MHELSRLAYLQALGTQSYISRGQLPGAAATRRQAIAPAAPSAPVAVQDSPTAPLADLAGEFAPQPAQDKVSPRPKPIARTDSGQQELSQTCAPASALRLLLSAVGYGWRN